MTGPNRRESPTIVPDAVPCAVADRQISQHPGVIELAGWLGTRIRANAQNRLARVELARLLEGYRSRPGRQAWDGEHVGKWLHAATLAWAHSGDVALRARLDQAVKELAGCQLSDGYLGTYTPADRWTEWDVWAHKYNLIGLITYIRYTGNLEPLSTCVRMADLLERTFGDGAGQRDLLTAGQHVGMAPTSVLEPMALLYRLTGEPRYLRFCEYILRAWERPNGPLIVSRLLDGRGVHEVGNGKAYEMLSCLVGAVELHRTSGDARLLRAVTNAWQDIVDHRLYPTGASSYRELFHGDHDFPDHDHVGETCVTVTWLQLNAQLLRLTGESRFAEQIERVVLNQLLGAQRPDGAAWGYYVEMEGVKPYSDRIDGHCCLSSGPRGIALIPTFAVTADPDGIVVNLYEAGRAKVRLADTTPVDVEIQTQYPTDGHIRIQIHPPAPLSFAIKFRVPSWCRSWKTGPTTAELGRDGYRVIRRVWSPGDALDIELGCDAMVIDGSHGRRGRATVQFGPLVLAAEERLCGCSLESLGLAVPRVDDLNIGSEPAPPEFRTWPEARVFRVDALDRATGAPLRAGLLPFADAGMTGGRYRVWIPHGDGPR